MDIETEIIAAIRRIIRAVDLRSRQLLEQAGVTGPQLSVLQLAGHRAEASASEISNALHLSRSTITGILNRLESRGLIKRNRNQRDRRGNFIEVTPAGRDLLSSAPPLMQDQFRRRLADLHDWEQTAILAALQRLASMMDAGSLSAAAVLDAGPSHPNNTRVSYD